MGALIAEPHYAPKVSENFASAHSAAGSLSLLKPESSSLTNSVECRCAIVVGSKGQVRINGMKVAVGLTLQGSQTITTANGEVIVELGRNGLFVLGPRSKVSFTNEDDGVRITCLSETCTLTVRDGEVHIEGKTNRVLRKGDEMILHSGDVAAYVERAYVAINTKEKGSARLVGLIALIGIGAVVATGVGVIDTPPSSATIP